MVSPFTSSQTLLTVTSSSSSLNTHIWPSLLSATKSLHASSS